jgi:hypothetical protein
MGIEVEVDSIAQYAWDPSSPLIYLIDSFDICPGL